MTSAQSKTQQDGDRLKREITPTSLDALIALLKQAETFYVSAAHHLRDYRSVIEVFEDLAGECRRFRAELSALSDDGKLAGDPETDMAFDFSNVVGGVSSLAVMEAERGTAILLNRYEFCVNVTNDAAQTEMFRRHTPVLMQIKAELSELKRALYMGESVDQT
ncbi:MAG: hypothetical protein WAO83_23480 [Fuerstiella sp.]